MSAPIIASRLQRRFIVMSGDDALAAALRAALPENWQMVQTNDLGELGGFQDVLQYRFILLDLDAGEVFGPLETIREVRMKMMLNVPIFCFGGDAGMRDWRAPTVFSSARRWSGACGSSATSTAGENGALAA